MTACHPSHQLWLLRPFVFCGRCGAYAAGRAYKIRLGCKGLPGNGSARDKRGRLLEGKHPVTGRFLGAPLAVGRAFRPVAVAGSGADIGFVPALGRFAAPPALGPVRGAGAADEDVAEAGTTRKRRITGKTVDPGFRKPAKRRLRVKTRVDLWGNPAAAEVGMEVGAPPTPEVPEPPPLIDWGAVRAAAAREEAERAVAPDYGPEWMAIAAVADRPRGAVDLRGATFAPRNVSPAAAAALDLAGYDVVVVPAGGRNAGGGAAAGRDVGNVERGGERCGPKGKEMPVAQEGEDSDPEMDRAMLVGSTAAGSAAAGAGGAGDSSDEDRAMMEARPSGGPGGGPGSGDGAGPPRTIVLHGVPAMVRGREPAWLTAWRARQAVRAEAERVHGVMRDVYRAGAQGQFRDWAAGGGGSRG